jgi:hypothetical protein
VDAGLFPELTMFTGKGQQLSYPTQHDHLGRRRGSARAASVSPWAASAFLFAGRQRALRAERLTLDDIRRHTTLSRWNFSAGAGLAVLLGWNE